jgi:hypothetical protein
VKELLHKRTYTAKHFLSDRNFLAEFHIGHIHFRDGALKNGEFRDINTELVFNPSSGLYQMTEASYEAEIGLDGSVRFHNVDHSLETRLQNPFSVQPEQYQDSAFGRLGKALIWKNILQDGGHQIVEARNNALAKIYRFEKKPVSNQISFEVIGSTGLKFWSEKGQQLTTFAKTGEKVLFGKTQDRVSFLSAPMAWNHRGERVPIRLSFAVIGGKLIATKTIPQAFIDKTFTEAGAWLETDDTSTFFSGAGDGTVLAADQPDYPPSTATDASYSVTTDYLQSNHNVGLYALSRLFFPVNTSSLPDNAIINSATFSLFGFFSVENADSDSACVIQTSQASTSSLSTSDWNSVGGSIAATKTFASWSTTDYNDFSFNSAYLGWINKTGFTKLGLRALRDINAQAPTGFNSIQMYFSENAGTSKDPKLVVTYSVPEEVLQKREHLLPLYRM